MLGTEQVVTMRTYVSERFQDSQLVAEVWLSLTGMAEKNYR